MILRILILIILLSWCVVIIMPFLIPVLWGSILAVTLYPLYSKLLKLLKGRKGLSGTITTLLLLLLLIIPSVLLISAMVEGTGKFITTLREGTVIISPPKDSVQEWPLIGKTVYNTWMLIATNLEAAIKQYNTQIITIAEKLVGAIKSVASNLLMLCLSIIISGVLLATSEKSERSIQSLAKRIGGERGEEFSSLIVLTIRNVAKGILGVAFIQFVLMGIVLVLAKVPLAGLWAFLVLILAIIQLPTAFVGIPVIIYLYVSREPLPATLWSVLIIAASLSDNILKPYLMGKGAPVPMLVIFLGAIGGMIMSGFIGLFTGAIILSLGYKLIMIWMEERSAE